MNIEIKELEKFYKKKHALQNINCLLEPHIYGLIGPNGSGKTTLIRCLLQLVHYQKGEIIFTNDNQEIIPFKDIQIGYLPQLFDTFKELTVYEQLEYFLVLKNTKIIDINKEIERVLTIVNLQEQKKEKTKNLSGGMIRRLGIAQTLLGFPDLLIFDEPTVGLDPDERFRFKEIIKSLKLNIPIILSTHIIEDVSSICSQVIFMKNGQLKYIGGIKDLLTQLNVYTCSKESFKQIKEEKIVMETTNDEIRFISQQVLKYPFLIKETPTIEDLYQSINHIQ